MLSKSVRMFYRNILNLCYPNQVLRARGQGPLVRHLGGEPADDAERLPASGARRAEHAHRAPTGLQRVLQARGDDLQHQRRKGERAIPGFRVK